jgi:ubiquinone/menaquinone biosynthesis C-methylase UbiE
MTGAIDRRQFLHDYGRIRSAEGRGSATSEYYRSLPFDSSWQWQIRARTYRYFVRHVLPRTPCDILDLGAGNCWLSYRLREKGHSPVAVDIFSDALDGLRAARHYPQPFPVLEADFNQLPVPDRSFDLVVFNASFHYSADYARTLREVRRCLRRGGRVAILDSPVYARRDHGERMREERQQAFERQYGFRSEALRSVEFFDEQMLRDLARELNMKWEIRRPWYGWRWHLRPAAAKLAGKRPPSRFWILVGAFE